MNPASMKWAATNIFSKLMNDKIVVGCVTCNMFFLNMKWKDYLPLLNGDYTTPTKWYNKVALHYCQYPDHEILSNKNSMGFNEQFNFTEHFTSQLKSAGITVFDLIHVVREVEEKVKDAPI